MTPVLETRDLSKNFDAVVAADAISLTVVEDEVVGIIGANGAGKTTFVNMVTGYLKPSSGSILYLGRDITPLQPRDVTKLGICRSFQIPQLFPEISVLDNLLVALTISGERSLGVWHPARTPAAVEAANEVLATYGIGDYRDQNAGTLPQGTRKLLDIAMATMGNPKLVMLDEPTSGISVDEKFTAMDTLMGALRMARVTIMFIEHDMEIVERYAKRVIAFYDGRIIADGAPGKVLSDARVRELVVGVELHRRVRAKAH